MFGEGGGLHPTLGSVGSQHMCVCVHHTPYICEQKAILKDIALWFFVSLADSASFIRHAMACRLSAIFIEALLMA